MAFNHPGPLWPVHIVVIPKPHIGSLLELGEFAITATALLRAVADIAKDISQQHGASRVVTNLGKYQDVDHLAFHVSYGEPLAQDT